MKQGPLWTVEGNIESKKLLIRGFDEDIKRTTDKRHQAMEELKEWELAADILKNNLK
jgi:hypothetical protein